MNPDREPRVPDTESVREGFGLSPGVRKYEDRPVPLHVLPYRPEPRRDLWKRIDRLCELRVSRCRPGYLHPSREVLLDGYPEYFTLPPRPPEESCYALRGAHRGVQADQLD